MINFSNLEYFVVLTQELSFSRASKRLFISQQSLSAHIARMEAELGVTLFERTKPLTLTSAGRHLEMRAREILELHSQTLREMSSSTALQTKTLTLGASYAYGRALLPKIMPSFYQMHPTIQFSLVERNAESLDAALTEGSIDLILGRFPFSADHVHYVPVCEDRLILMIPEKLLFQTFGSEKDHILQLLQKTADITLLAKCPFLLTKQGRVRSLSEDLFLSKNMIPKIIMETETIETAVVLCQSGIGVLISPSLFVHGNRSSFSTAANSDIHIIPLSDLSFGTIGIGYSTDRFITDSMKAFIQIACDQLKSNNPIS